MRLRTIEILVLTTILTQQTITLAEDSTGASAESASRGSSENDQMLQRLISWFQEKGGVIHPKVEIRLTDPNIPDSYGGVFAIDDIEEGEDIFVLPPETVISEDDAITNHRQPLCIMVERILKEKELGNSSEFGPYIDYIFTQQQNILPYFWSKDGQEALTELIESDEYIDLPPNMDFLPDFLNEDICSDYMEKYPEYFTAAEILLSRGWETVMLPFCDMINHFNDIDNIDFTWMYTGGTVRAFAKKDIAKGEELFHSYTHSNGGPKNHKLFGTPEVMRDYGFLEPDHQRWHFNAFDRSTIIIRADGSSKWIDSVRKYRSEDLVAFFDYQYQRVSNLTFPQKGMPQHEYDLFTAYHKSLARALRITLEKVRAFDDDSFDDEDVDSDDDSFDDEENSGDEL